MPRRAGLILIAHGTTSQAQATWKHQATFVIVEVRSTRRSLKYALWSSLVICSHPAHSEGENSIISASGLSFPIGTV